MKVNTYTHDYIHTCPTAHPHASLSCISEDKKCVHLGTPPSSSRSRLIACRSWQATRRLRCACRASFGVQLKVEALGLSHRLRSARALHRRWSSHGLASDYEPVSSATSPLTPCRLSNLGAKMSRHRARSFSATCVTTQKLLNQSSTGPTSIDPSPAPYPRWRSTTLSGIRDRSSAILFQGSRDLEKVSAHGCGVAERPA